ncbi:MAG: hypothetical protein M3340_15000, partial [Actinomycetota bacterium]|nr:hypothetical protein [Actinomycetota bacterium]
MESLPSTIWTQSTTPPWAEALRRRIERAVALARRERRRIIAGISVPLDESLDLSAAVLAARSGGEAAFCFEQPDRDRFALAGLGTAAVVEASGADRFAAVVRECRELAHGALTDGAEPAWVGGFAFAPEGGRTPEWSGFAPAQLTLPEAVLRRQGDRATLT